MTQQTSEPVSLSVDALWTSYETLAQQWERACRKTREFYAAYEKAWDEETEAWNASKAAYAAYRAAVDGGK